MQKWVDETRQVYKTFAVETFYSQDIGLRCSAENAPAAVEEMRCYCQKHPTGPAAIRRPQLLIRGDEFVVLLGRSITDGVVGLGATVSSALDAFEEQYLKAVRPPLQYLADVELERLEMVIQERGSCLIAEEQLKLLFPEEESQTKRFLLLADLAIKHRWSFEFRPRVGDVRIVSLVSGTAPNENATDSLTSGLP